jgi:hypothetical protein
VKVGGAIELHAAFREESRTILLSSSATRQEIRESRDLVVVFSQGKTTPRDLYQAIVIAKPRSMHASHAGGSSRHIAVLQLV